MKYTLQLIVFEEDLWKMSYVYHFEFELLQALKREREEGLRR